jgi:hypothetical protein
VTPTPRRRWSSTRSTVAFVVSVCSVCGITIPAPPARAQSGVNPPPSTVVPSPPIQGPTAASPAGGATTAYESATAVVGSRPPLDTTFAISLHSVSVHTALDAISHQSGIPLNFDTDLVDALPQRVTIARAHTTVACALATTLKGTGLAAQATAWQRIVLTAARDSTLHAVTCKPRL